MDEAYICIAPASIWFTKQWPAPKWIELINALEDRYLVCLIGSKQDRELCASIKNLAKTQRIKILAGDLSLLESAALMKSARMNFVNDSAPLHLASAMNAPVTAIFCSTVPAFGFGPLSDKNFIAETALELDCRPCGIHGYHECPLGHFKCAEIEVKNIIGNYNA
jgi:heptosyltransferase-2